MKEKSWLIKGDATGSAIAFHSLLYLILTYNFMFILKGYIRTNKHWLHLLLSIKKNAGCYAKEYKFCFSPHLLLSSLSRQIRCYTAQPCRLCCSMSLGPACNGTSAQKGRTFSCAWLASRRLSPPSCTVTLSAPALSKRVSDCGFCLLGQRMIKWDNAWP